MHGRPTRHVSRSVAGAVPCHLACNPCRFSRGTIRRFLLVPCKCTILILSAVSTKIATIHQRNRPDPTSGDQAGFVDGWLQFRLTTLALTSGEGKTVHNEPTNSANQHLTDRARLVQVRWHDMYWCTSTAPVADRDTRRVDRPCTNPLLSFSSINLVGKCCCNPKRRTLMQHSVGEGGRTTNP